MAAPVIIGNRRVHWFFNVGSDNLALTRGENKGLYAILRGIQIDASRQRLAENPRHVFGHATLPTFGTVAVIAACTKSWALSWALG